MNKHLYRIVFNQARNMLMVVAEIARSARPGDRRAPGLGHTLSQRLIKLSALSFGLLLALGAVQPAAAGVAADRNAPGNQQPTIINSANGTPQINIQTAGKGGVSRNLYSRFDVDQKGVILNNSRVNAQTQLGGMITANPWLAKGEASVILNEVNARDPSKLNGFIEVAGKSAQVVIANPSGITCDGCGFINANRTTLTTGNVQLNNGLVTGYDVARGEIVIQGMGMDSSRQDHTDLIARSVKVNAGLWVRDLKITTGVNHVDGAHQQISAKNADGAPPAFALDVAQLGGMYAGKIRLTGTEQGVGVRNAGAIGASAGDVVVNADGSLTNSGTLDAAQHLQLNVQGKLDNQGRLYASGNTQLKLGDTLTNTGIIAAAQHTVINAAAVTSQSNSVLAAGINSDGTAGASGALTVTSQGALNAHGQNLAASSMTLHGAAVDLSGSQSQAQEIAITASRGDISTASGNLSAGRLTLSTSALLNNNSGKIAADKLALTAARLSNQKGVIQQLGTGDLTLNHSGGINNREGILASNGNNLTLITGELDNQQGELIHAGSGMMSLTLDRQLNNQQGNIAANGSIDLHADSLNNAQGSLLAAQNGSLTLDINQDLNNEQGQIGASQNLVLRSDNLNNQQGFIAALRELSLKSHGLDNEGGLLQSGSAMSLDLQGGSLSNRFSGGILSQGSLWLSAGEVNNEQGVMMAGENAWLSTLALHNLNGTLASEKAVKLSTQQLNNQHGRIQAGTALEIDTQSHTLDNRSGELNAGEAMSLKSGALFNLDGQILSLGELALHTQGQEVDNQQGSIAAAGNARIDSGAWNNRSGQLQVVGNLILNALNALLENSAGLIRSGAQMTLNAGQIVNVATNTDNSGIEARSVTLNSDRIDNSNGIVRTTDLLDITSGQTLNNRDGLLSSGATLNVNGAASLSVINSGGTLIAGKNLNLTASELSGDGSLLSQDAMQLLLQQTFFNQGEVIASGDLDFSLSQQVINENLITAGGVLTLNATALENRQSGEIAAGENHLLIAGELTNYGLLDGELTHIAAATLNNIGSGRIYGDRIALQAETLNNLAEAGTAATIAARDRLDIGTSLLNNRDHALIYSAGDLFVGGTLDAGAQASGQAKVLNNHSATLESAGNMTLNISEINNINDNLVLTTAVVEESTHHEAALKGATTRYDWDEVDLSYKDKYNVQYALMPDGTRDRKFYEYEYQRTITETQVSESDPGQIIAGGNLSVNSGRVNNHDSRILAGGTLGGAIGELNNVATLGERIITDVGQQTYWYDKKTSKPTGTATSQGKKKSSYDPEAIIQRIDPGAMQWQGNTRVEGSGTSIAGRDTTGVEMSIIHAGNISADLAQRPVTPPAGHVVEIALPPAMQDNSGAVSIIRITAPDTRLPDNSLYRVNPAANLPYLIETDARFTGQRQWLSSDYMMSQFQQNGDNVLKRLGDGYYEQKLIRDQIVRLTGLRYLEGYSNDEDQYKALMEAGVDFAQRYNLTPGVALTPAQMAMLTSDMVWLVKQEITLADGSVQSVLVPQVYARVREGDLDGSGALLAGNNVSLDIKNDLTNSGHINGREVTLLSAENLHNSGFIGGNQLSLAARADINNIGGILQGTGSLFAQAGRDINSISTLGENNRYLDRPAGIYVQNDNGTLALQALNNINLTATQISNAGSGSQTQILAGHDLNLNTLTTTSGEYARWGKSADRSLTQQTDIGSQITVGGALDLQAGHDLNARAAQVSAQESLSAAAGNDLNILSGSASYHLVENSRQSSGGLLSGKSLRTHDDVYSQSVLGSNFSADSLTLVAGRDLTISGSQAAATGNVTLAAGNNLNITDASARHEETHLREEKKSGFSGTGGVGVSYGRQSVKTTDDAASLSSVGSLVGSTQGNVQLSAGNALTIKGSDVLAGKNLSLTGKEVSIQAAEHQSRQTHIVEQKQSGLTLALSGTVGSAVNTAVSGVNAASQANSGRLAALEGMKAALDGVRAYQGAERAALEGSTDTLFGVNLSLGSSSSRSEQTTTRSESQGSQLTAGNNLSIVATGSDINVQGSGLQAGKDISLNAARDVNLVSAQNSQRLEGKIESHGSSVGVGVNFGGGSNGLSLSASVNQSKGREQGNGVTHTETTVDAGSRVSIVSGRDTTLTGAQVSGESVKADVGRNLTLTSEQDSDRYEMKQQSVSGGVSVPVGGAGGSVSLNASRDRMHSDYASVQEQTGIFAGKGGFDIRVGEHTQLDGAVIGSTATADRNRLDTGTLGFSDIENRADYQVEHQGAGISSGGSIGGQFAGNLANGLLVGANNEGHDNSVTHAAVSDGAIIIRDRDSQQQDVAALSRDAEHANQTLSPIFDKEREQNRLAEAQLIGEIGAQAADIARTQGDISGLEAAKEKYPGMSADELRQTDTYKAEMAKFGTGSALQQGIQAATAAVQGLAGGNLAQAVSGAAAPYLAEQIHKLTEGNPEAQAMAHAVVGAVTSYASGNSALAGATGAVSGELMAQLVAEQLYPGRKVSELTETEKQTVSALGTLAAGLAGGLAGDSTAAVISGAQGGRNAVENNFLSVSEKTELELAKQKLQNSKDPAVREQAQQTINDLREKDISRDQKVIEACGNGKAGSAGCASARLDAIAAKVEYENTGNYNSKASQQYADAYGQIVNLLNITSVDAQNQQQVKDALTQYAMDVLGVDRQTAQGYVETKQGMDIIVASVTPILGSAAASKLGNISIEANTKASLLKEMTSQGIKYTPENIVQVAKNADGKIVFLETGNSKAGLQHIIGEHAKDFANIGVSEAQIPGVVMKAVSEGKIVGYQGKGTGRPIYETVINGEVHRLAITVSSNGFMVGANPAGRVK